ncbi:DnaB-like dsDNA helicase [Mycobacterium phage Sham4]|nr:DnaB-like dsDNA helicase [Mycobacterium phage Snape]QBI97895.1 DnaB-like dsDNA helicase [Mycobacterium phage Orange]QBI98236.1 DnaB-like dsDNA helicase [Mycobacterium phage Bowtie]QPX61992.1 DnaB-like dsDNA helicase [Mycobacterium phage Flaverint]UAW08938.1 DnaB-like dsDNA helicase [Mycobacterium phage Lucivia]UAW09324.1 DnaB-like dsDNA helicase [Mycobacterium phage Timothy]UOW92712.1 DnaB-like dsDNA helicase [Mycobacterium phage Sham4]UXE03379.1 DnaB-like dsDNA helicase [Mycobacterium ph
MYTARQSLYIRGSAGDPLPVVWESLSNTPYRRGQLVLICAGPGTGKSAFVLAYALKSKIPCLYFSADSDAFTQLTRSVSIISGWTLERAAQAVRSESLGQLGEALDDLPIRFNYKASPSLDEIENALAAYDALYEDFPHLIVVDNITNVRTDSEGGDDPFSGLESLMDYLHEMGRETGACVIGLHHVKGDYNDADKPIPLSGIKGQIGRVPEMVQTLHRVSDGFGPDMLNVSTVKNRGGKSDASGKDFVSLQFVGDTMQITDFGQ